MKTALITGANKGIGFEVAKILAKQGIYVYIGCRNLDNGTKALKELNTGGIHNVAIIRLDVTNQESIDEAKKEILKTTDVLDILVNNAGISGEFEQSAISSKIDEYKKVYETNVFGVISVTQTFLDMMEKSPEPRIVNVSTAMASLSLAAEIDNENYPKRYAIYQSSKSALNMYTLQLAYELKDLPFKVNAVCPGWTKTDFTNHQGTSTPEEAGQRIAKYVLLDETGPTAKFFSEEYYPAPANCPW
ncbi:NAD(P)-dependent dehydrogenase, short-chain alcohol dehydrogenase family [Chishuiella changwenlii]|uniref:NAD(P)-dependent dehydrogenase, short-chain alcohol dehydrogenase family n=1 Tax=Chishuiella changwenlii TaxID=1434701 RepID=A0A1M6ZB65_9FLAO|nr:SDR family oxidoreductase [Chishuiella changwenlii]GGE86589.1 short-chain dehydrogenase [Chishuiella changwenlii]SHL27605.1 NAD(P)-dependent dehydrogenase, short-chain alcohol dehydrogenase family [Chishuiella changwenlii]